MVHIALLALQVVFVPLDRLRLCSPERCDPTQEDVPELDRIQIEFGSPGPPEEPRGLWLFEPMPVGNILNDLQSEG